MADRKMNAELERWFNDRQSSMKVAKTTTTAHGHTIDWVPMESQVPSGKIATPPPNPEAHARAEHPERPVSPVRLEEIEQGPAGTVPILRPSLERMSRTLEVKGHLSKRGGLYVNRERRAKAPADPDPASYFHDTDSQNGRFYGWDGYLNMWDPAINVPAGGNGEDHSILQVWLQNYDKKVTQSVEGGWTVDRGLNGDTQPHVFTYYTTNGYSKDADNQGGYNRQFKGWVQYSSSVFPGIRINGTSVFGGPQYDISMKFQLYREPNSNDVNWWVNVQGIWMGYYPASLFNGGVGSVVEWLGCGGEVYSGLANPEKTMDQMGSGFQAAGGWTKAAFLRNLRNQSDMNGTMVNNAGVATEDAAAPGGADPYTIQLDTNSGTTWGTYMYVGGPAPVPNARERFSEITFDIGTGGDDLRGDSSATVTVALPNGPQTFTLKSQHDPSWGNNSDHVKSFQLAGAPQPASAFGDITIRLTSHDGIFETSDNWNIQSVNVTLNGSGTPTTLMEKSGDPLARLTGSQPSVTLHA